MSTKKTTIPTFLGDDDQEVKQGEPTIDATEISPEEQEQLNEAVAESMVDDEKQDDLNQTEEVIEQGTPEEVFQKKINLVEKYLKTPRGKALYLKIKLVGSGAAHIYQGSLGNVWAIFRMDRPDAYHKRSFQRRLVREVDKDLFNTSDI